MLRELAVQNLALIEDLRVELRPGFCAWTGETGAGKTLLLSALGLLLGERGSSDLIRSGAEELRVAGRFDLEHAANRAQAEALLGGPLEAGEVVISRRLTRAGRSFAYVNEQPVALSTLRRLGELLVDLHGQRESQSLLQPAYQLQLLDAYGGLEALRQQYEAAAEHLRTLRRHLRELQAAHQQRQRELALIRFEKEELDRAAVRPGELAELLPERERLLHAQSLQEFAAATCARLYEEEDSLQEQLGRLARAGQRWLPLDPALTEIVQRLEGLAADVQDLAQTLRALAERWLADPQRLAEVEERVQLLRRLETKYGRSADELADYRAQLDEQEARLLQEEQDQGELADKVRQAFAQLHQAGLALRQARQQAAQRLAAETCQHLRDLGMREARLQAVLEPIPLGDDPLTAEIPAHGLDHLELLLSANPGEPALPLRKVASGGELSRTMLALKTVLAEHDQVETLVFDEVDANVGGRLGDVLGQKLAALGRRRQIICVTHLPQVASYAPHQWSIRKVRRGKRLLTTITLLDDEERIEELASMLRGRQRSDTTRREVEAMLAAARQITTRTNSE